MGLYLHPPEVALVLCVDEDSRIRELSRTQPPLPMRPGTRERQTHDPSSIRVRQCPLRKGTRR